MIDAVLNALGAVPLFVDVRADKYIVFAMPRVKCEPENRFELAEQFLSMKAESPQLLYIWGHSYELDAHDGWGEFERLLKMLAFRDEIIYDTNRALLL